MSERNNSAIILPFYKQHTLISHNNLSCFVVPMQAKMANCLTAVMRRYITDSVHKVKQEIYSSFYQRIPLRQEIMFFAIAFLPFNGLGILRSPVTMYAI